MWTIAMPFTGALWKPARPAFASPETNRMASGCQGSQILSDISGGLRRRSNRSDCDQQKEYNWREESYAKTSEWRYCLRDCTASGMRQRTGTTRNVQSRYGRRNLRGGLDGKDRRL